MTWKRFPLLPLCQGKSPVAGGFPAQIGRNEMLEYFLFSLNKTNSQIIDDLRPQDAQSDVTVMLVSN